MIISGLEGGTRALIISGLVSQNNFIIGGFAYRLHRLTPLHAAPQYNIWPNFSDRKFWKSSEMCPEQ